MNHTPLVSVICLCYNHESYIEECLLSVINQTYPKIEIIIVDDFSSDTSTLVIENFIKKHPNINFIKNHNNIGNTKSFNKALKLCMGEYIVDLATDDVLYPDFIEKHLVNFRNNKSPNIGVSYSNVEFINEIGKHIKYHYEIDSSKKAIKKPPEGNIYRELLHSYFLNAASMMTKKKVMEELSGYDENLLYEDLDFWFRSSRIFDYAYSDHVLIKKRVLSTSLGSSLRKKGTKQRKLGNSTYKTCLKAFKLNKNREENLALINRIRYEMRLAFYNFHFSLLTKFIALRIYLTIKNIYLK